jgi:DNA-binding HxlR family transcriptional regulator
MKWVEAADTLCPVAQASAILGDRWTLLILRETFLGATSFDTFQARIGLSPHILSGRLKRLVAEDILARREGVRGTYHLTASGRALLPVILSLAKWGNDWRGGTARHTEHVHTRCGHAFDPVLACSECGEPVGLNVETTLSRKLSRERARRETINSRRKSS